MRYFYLTLLLCLIVFNSGCGKHNKAEQKALTPVVTAMLKPQLAKNVQYYSGIINAYKNIQVISEVEGLVKKVYFDVGDRVASGSVLAKFDDLIYQASYERARSGYDLAKVTQQRQEALFKENVISQQQLDSGEANLKQAYASYLIAKKSYDDCQIKSPIDGTVAEKNIQEGSYVKNNDKVFVLINYDKVEIPIGVTEKYITKLKEWQRAEVTVDSLPDKTFTGFISAIGLLADQSTGAFPVKITVPNPQHTLKAGMVGKVALVVEALPEAKVVTLDMLVNKGEEKGIMFLDVKNSIARFKPVQVLFETGEQAVISGPGVEFGKTIITKGQKNIVDGEKVVTVNE